MKQYSIHFRGSYSAVVVGVHRGGQQMDWSTVVVAAAVRAHLLLIARSSQRKGCV
jgi:hypothetical protein